MAPTRVEIIKVGLGFLALCGILIALNAYMNEREARVKLTEQVKASEDQIKVQAKVIDEAQNSISARDQVLSKAVKSIEALKAKPATLPQIATELPHYIPLSSPPTITIAPTEPLVAPEAGMPVATTSAAQKAVEQVKATQAIVFNEAQAQDLRAFYLTCSEQKEQLLGCVADRDDDKRIIASQQAQLLQTQKERDAALIAVKGGTFWTRAWHDTKVVAISVVVGVGIGYAVHH